MDNNTFERDAIANTQRYLRHLSYHDDDINPVPVDGIWDSETQRALTAFQRKSRLPETGRVDRATWELLRERYNESVAMNSPPARLDIFPRMPRDFKVNIGDESFIVTAVQYIIKELEQFYAFGAYEPSGVYDDATAERIRLFQDKNGIAATGNVDRETWDALAVQHNLFANYSQ